MEKEKIKKENFTGNINLIKKNQLEIPKLKNIISQKEVSKKKDRQKKCSLQICKLPYECKLEKYTMKRWI